MDELGKKDRLRRAAEQLAADASPDWDHLLDSGEQLADLENLRQLELIAQAFTAGRGLDRAGPAAHFTWKHLDVFERIGEGGFGEVFRAYDPSLQREVALKLRRQSTRSEDPYPDQTFVQEARRLARVRHPNVLAVHGADSDAGRVGLWSDLVPGQSLQQIFDAGDQQTPQSVLALAAALSSALEAIHRAGLIHGDIKASNVMLQPDGTPVLMDFGAAVERDGSGLSAVAGSPLVMAPELLDGAIPAASSDQYSLGVLLYQTLTGSYPFQADCIDDLIERHHQAAAIDWHTVPRIFRDLLRRLLSRDPAKRPSARATCLIVDELRRRPQRRRRRIAVGAVIISLTIGVAAATYGLMQARQSERAAVASRNEAQDLSRFMIDLLQAPRGFGRGANSLVLDLIDDAARELEQSPPVDRNTAARYRYALGRTYTSMDSFEKAQTLLEQALSDLQRVQAPARDIVPCLIALGINAHRSGRNEEAAKVFIEAEAMALGHLGRSHPLTIEAAYRQGMVIWAMGDTASARTQLVEAVEASRELPPEDSLAGLIENSLATLLRNAGELDAAERLARSALERQLRNHGPSHVNVISARDTLGTILNEQGRYSEAEALLRANLEVLEERAPEGGARTRLTLNNLSSVLDLLGRDQEAMEMNRRALEMTQSTLGPTHVQTLVVTTNMAVRLTELGFLDEAELTYREVIAKATDAFGNRHQVVLLSSSNLAELLLNAGRLDEAESLARATMRTNKEALGDSHMFTLFTMDILGAALTRLGRANEGRIVLEDVYQSKLKIVGADNPYAWDSATYLAEAHLELGEWQQAQLLLVDVVDRRTATLGIEDPKTRDAVALLERARLVGANEIPSG